MKLKINSLKNKDKEIIMLWKNVLFRVFVYVIMDQVQHLYQMKNICQFIIILHFDLFPVLQ
jgi:hypothetical protein